MSKKLFIKTYGCQMNVYDSLRMQDLLEPFGYQPTSEIDQADMIILNTCHIREKAAEKMYSELGRLKQIKDRRKKLGKTDIIIAVAGCVAQAEGDEIFSRSACVDIVVGPQSYHTLPELIAKVARLEKQLISLDFIEEAKFDQLTQPTSFQGPSSYVSVQEGCDKFCTFCVVPYTRGAEFSRPLEQIYREVLRAVVSGGAQEIILLGQNVNAYHGKTPEGQDCSLADLITYLSKITSLKRIRYLTSHPVDMTDDLIALYGSEPKLMPFLHLPVQSGSNKILKAMNRRHSREDYLKIIERCRALRPDIALSSDFIVGFPGETDEDFADTLDLVAKIGYGQCYSFKYSPRPGTPASIQVQIAENIKNDRLRTLQNALQKQQLSFNQSCVGQTMPVLFERAGRFDSQIIGKTPYMQSVHVGGLQDNIGKIFDVEITQGLPRSLTGIISRPALALTS